MYRTKLLKIVFILFLIFAAILGGMVLYSNRSRKRMETNLDAIRFSKEYKNVREDNPFVYRSLDEINTILEHGTGVVYLGFPECPWCQKYVQYLNEVANELGVEKIYYFNILQERKSNTESYKKTVSLLENYLLKDDEGKSRIYVPDITVVLNGQIVGHDNEGSLVTKEDGTPDQYWTEQRIGNLKRRLTIMFEKLKEESCSSCHI